VRLRVKLFASFREIVGARELEWDIEAPASVRDLLVALVDRYPGLSSTIDQGLIALNHEYVARDTPLSDDDEVGLIPPVSGGALA